MFLDNPAVVARYATDAQAAFDRALDMIAAAGKWASAWNPEGMGTNADPSWKGLTEESCKMMVDSWLKIGADSNLALQGLAVPFFAEGHNPFKPPGPSPPPGPAPPPRPRPPSPPPPPAPLPGCTFALKQNFCARAAGSPVISSRLHTSPVTCCRACMADATCKSWTLDSRNQSVCVCYLQSVVNDPAKGHTAVGCTSGVPPPPPPPPIPVVLDSAREPFFSQNNTLAAFLIARGEGGGFLELPVCGAFESMADYDLSNPLLSTDFGTPLGPGKETASGHYKREFKKATITLDCDSWRSTFVMK